MHDPQFTSQRMCSKDWTFEGWISLLHARRMESFFLKRHGTIWPTTNNWNTGLNGRGLISRDLLKAHVANVFLICVPPCISEHVFVLLMFWIQELAFTLCHIYVDCSLCNFWQFRKSYMFRVSHVAIQELASHFAMSMWKLLVLS